jgi:hypothetical protein
MAAYFIPILLGTLKQLALQFPVRRQSRTHFSSNTVFTQQPRIMFPTLLLMGATNPLAFPCSILRSLRLLVMVSMRLLLLLSPSNYLRLRANIFAWVPFHLLLSSSSIVLYLFSFFFFFLEDFSMGLIFPFPIKYHLSHSFSSVLLLSLFCNLIRK